MNRRKHRTKFALKYFLRAACLTVSVSCASLMQFSTVARAASDITIAAIATGRLYVVGTTERPNTPAVLEGRFRTESDDKGKFQFEAVYHPARCIIGVQIEGRTYEAVVSNCGQQGLPAEPDSAKRTGALEANPVQIAPPGSPGPKGPAGPSAAPSIAATPKNPSAPAAKKLPPPAAQAQIKRAPAPQPRPKPYKKPQPLQDDVTDPADASPTD